MQIFVSYVAEPGNQCAMWASPAQFRNNVGVEEVHRRSDGVAELAAAPRATRRNLKISSRVIAQEQVLEGWPGRVLQSSPIGCGHEDRSLRTPFGDGLWAFLQAGFEHFAESRFRILNRPGSHRLLCSEHMTSQIT